MDLGIRCGQTALDMKEHGKVEKPVVRENSFMQMEMYMKENG